MDFSNIKGWNPKGEGWIEKKGCVATFNVLAGKEGIANSYQYTENSGRLIKLTDYLPDKKAPIIGDFKGKAFKAGESLYKFDRIYDALKSLGTFKLREVYIKEQPEPERITSFYYLGEWFILAPIVNVKEDIDKGKLILLEVK